MTVNTLSVAALGFALAILPARAAQIDLFSPRTAEIHGHDVYSRFLPGAFIALPDGWSGGSNLQAKTVDLTPSTRSGVLLQDDEQLSTPPMETMSVARDPDLGSEGSDSGSGDGYGMGPVGGGLAPGVSTVPLPPALPMFGGALLTFCALGVARRRRAAATGA